MNPLLSARVALRALRVNKLRSALTMLGIIIGVAAVIAMVGVGAGAQARVAEQIQSLGSNMIIVLSGSITAGGVRMGSGSQLTITEDDAWAIQREIRTVAGVLAGAHVVAGCASVSLLVGGIGIMNIMLVSVTERTREIGLRMAVGARGRDILVKFLVEAVTLSLLGGVLGIGLGLGGSYAIAYFAQWRTLVSVEAVAVAFVVSAAVGVFFGFYPARQASRLNPIDALRYE